MCCSFLDTLQSFNRRGGQERVAEVEARDDECLDQELSCFPREGGLDPADVVEGGPL